MQYNALVLSGGGINGVAHVGCLAGLGDLLTNVDAVVGTSAGALVAAIFCLGLDMRDVFRTLYAMDRRRLGSVSSFETMMTSFGADDGKGLETLIRTFVPPSLTFADLLRDRGKTLLITATCLTDGEGVVFGPETHADMPVALAVRMSCSIPLVFAAVRHESKLYVDGSVLDNFPIEVALRRKKKQQRVLGISVSRFHEKPENVVIETFGDFARTLMGTIVAAAQQRPRGRVSTIDIHSQVPIPTLFDVTDTQIAYLYNLGYVKGNEFRRKVA